MVINARADMVTLSDVPAYEWYHGCAPTAAAMLFGYWDLKGYRGLFDASGADLYETANVQDQISSPAHNAKYDPSPDDPNLPDPPDTSIADFLHTSEGPMVFGGTAYADLTFGVARYAAYRGYPFGAIEEYWYAGLWGDFTREIDAGRPVLINVDTDMNLRVDHTMLALGYDDRGAEGRWYGAYTTWEESEQIAWYQFRSLSVLDQFSVGGLVRVFPANPPDPPEVVATPEPASILLLASLGTYIFVFRTRRAHRG